MMGHSIETFKEIGDTIGTQEEADRYNGVVQKPLTAHEEASLRLKAVEMVIAQHDFDLHDLLGCVEAFISADRLFNYAVTGRIVGAAPLGEKEHFHG